MEPTGTIVFTTIDRADYGFDIFSAKLPTNFHYKKYHFYRRNFLSISINFSSQFFDEDKTIIYVSERTGSSRIYLNRPQISKPELIQTPTESLFHDRPVINNGRVYYVSTHEPPEKPFRSWSALYSTRIDDGKTVRLTPYGSVDYSPAISKKSQI
ncbi:tolB protein-related [Abeliophyllum distichum]|uniref:TolB protein-related n=1 Tax=Abeliophyllum distichum TaxID=126358 RepID=A0ABD1P3B9_9LAMI